MDTTNTPTKQTLEPVELHIDSGDRFLKLAYAYDRVQAQQYALATAIYEHRATQNQSPNKPKSAADYIRDDGTFYRERAIAYLVRERDDSGTLKPFDMERAETVIFAAVKCIEGEQLESLEVIERDFFTRRKMLDLLSIAQSNAVLQQNAQISLQWMQARQNATMKEELLQLVNETLQTLGAKENSDES